MIFSDSFGDYSKVCYLLLPEGLKADILSVLQSESDRHKCRIVCLWGMDWNNDMTPWCADPVFKSGKPFKGKAQGFLEELTSEIIPRMEKDAPAKERFLIGISLSGLFAAWAACRCDLFDGFASLSGSFWYPSFAEWFCSQSISERLKCAHISLGDREAQTRNVAMQAVGSCTEMIAEHLKSSGIETDYSLFEGTHFSPILPRLQAAISFLS